MMLRYYDMMYHSVSYHTILLQHIIHCIIIAGAAPGRAGRVREPPRGPDGHRAGLRSGKQGRDLWPRATGMQNHSCLFISARC